MAAADLTGLGAGGDLGGRVAAEITDVSVQPRVVVQLRLGVQGRPAVTQTADVITERRPTSAGRRERGAIFGACWE